MSEALSRRFGHGGRSRFPGTAFLVLALLMSVNAFYAVFHGGVDAANNMTSVPSNRDNLVYVGLWLLLYAVSGVMVLRSFWQRGIDYRFLLLIPFALYIVASATWSQVPMVSAVPATMLALNIVIAAALAVTIHPVRFLQTSTWLFIGLMVCSFALLAISPDSVKSDPTRPGILMTGQLFGAFGNKGVLGLSGCAGIITLIFLPETAPRPWHRWSAMALLGLGVVMSNSAGAVAASIVAVGTLTMARVFPGLRVLVFSLACGFSIVWSFVLPFINIGAIAEALGRSPDLTGRGTFWPLAPGFIMDRPVLGYGYLAFFNAGPYSRAWEIWEHELYFFTPEFHNSFLDIMIGLGLVGAFGYFLVLASASAIFMHRTLDRACADVMCALMILMTIGSATEFLFLAHNAFSTIFLFYCFLVGGRRYGPRAIAPSARAEPSVASRQGRLATMPPPQRPLAAPQASRLQTR